MQGAGLNPKTAPAGASSSLADYAKARKAWQAVVDKPEAHDKQAKEKAHKAVFDALAKVNLVFGKGDPRNIKKHSDPKGKHVGMSIYINRVKDQTEAGKGLWSKRLQTEFEAITK